MLRTTIFGFIACLFALAHALPTVSGTTNGIQARDPKKKGHKKPPHYKPQPSNNCPTGLAYYLQTSTDGSYAQLRINLSASPDTFIPTFGSDKIVAVRLVLDTRPLHMRQLDPCS